MFLYLNDISHTKKKLCHKNDTEEASMILWQGVLHTTLGDKP
jgi:hypothetical protein